MKILKVGLNEEHTTIQSAIDQIPMTLKEDYKILIEAGEYKEHTLMNNRAGYSIKFEAQEGAKVWYMRFYDSLTNITIDGLTFSWLEENTYYTALLFSRINNAIVKNCKFLGNFGESLITYDGANGEISECVFGGGSIQTCIHVVSGSKTKIYDNILERTPVYYVFSQSAIAFLTGEIPFNARNKAYEKGILRIGDTLSDGLDIQTITGFDVTARQQRAMNAIDSISASGIYEKFGEECEITSNLGTIFVGSGLIKADGLIGEIGDSGITLSTSEIGESVKCIVVFEGNLETDLDGNNLSQVTILEGDIENYPILTKDNMLGNSIGVFQVELGRFVNSSVGAPEIITTNVKKLEKGLVDKINEKYVAGNFATENSAKIVFQKGGSTETAIITTINSEEPDVRLYNKNVDGRYNGIIASPNGLYRYLGDIGSGTAYEKMLTENKAKELYFAQGEELIYRSGELINEVDSEYTSSFALRAVTDVEQPSSTMKFGLQFSEAQIIISDYDLLGRTQVGLIIQENLLKLPNGSQILSKSDRNSEYVPSASWANEDVICFFDDNKRFFVRINTDVDKRIEVKGTDNDGKQSAIGAIVDQSDPRMYININGSYVYFRPEIAMVNEQLKTLEAQISDFENAGLKAIGMRKRLAELQVKKTEMSDFEME